MDFDYITYRAEYLTKLVKVLTQRRDKTFDTVVAALLDLEIVKVNTELAHLETL